MAKLGKLFYSIKDASAMLGKDEDEIAHGGADGEIKLSILHNGRLHAPPPDKTALFKGCKQTLLPRSPGPLTLTATAVKMILVDGSTAPDFDFGVCWDSDQGYSPEPADGEPFKQYLGLSPLRPKLPETVTIADLVISRPEMERLLSLPKTKESAVMPCLQPGDFYSSKLAAAFEAWIAVSGDPQLLKNKTPYRALEDWLKANFQRFDGLVHKKGSVRKTDVTGEDGTILYKKGSLRENDEPNMTGITETARVANWKPGGPPATA
jgi:hypothetical protein